MTTPSSIVQKSIRQAPIGRVAISLMFLMNGFILGNWAPKIPFFLNSLNITEAAMGSLILMIGLGGLMVMPVAGYLISKFGSQTPTRYFAVLASFTLLIITLAPSFWLAGFCMFLTGVFLIGMDICMNSNVLVVEKKHKIKFMSSCHGWWSVGGIIGSLTAGVIIETVGILNHVIFVTVICLLVVSYAWPKILIDPQVKIMGTKPFSIPKKPTIYVLGIMSFLSILPEGAVIDWSALYLIDELGSSISTAGYAFAALSAAMAIIRFFGDYLRKQFGSIIIMRASCIMGGIGMVIGGQATNVVMAMIGFGIAGIGIANLVPIIISAAGKQEGISSGVGISTVGFMASIGLMSAPAFLGYVAEFISFSTIFTMTAVSFVAVFFLSPLTQNADDD